MKLNLKILFVLLLINNIKGDFLHAQEHHQLMRDSLELYNPLLSPQEMKDDLEILRNIHEQANSGLYFYRTNKEVDSLYNWALQRTDQPIRKIAFYKTILSIIDFEGSSHNYTELDADLIAFLEQQKSFFPYSLRYIEENIIFDGTNAAIPSGSKILKINGIEAPLIMESLYKYFPADGFTKTKKMSSSVERSFDLYYLLEYGLTDTYVIKYVAPGEVDSRTVVIPSTSLDEMKSNHKKRFSAPVTDRIDFKTQDPYSFQMLTPNIGLLNLRWFGFVTGEDDPDFEGYVHFLDSVFTDLADRQIENLIIDIRNNPGGSDPAFEQPVMFLTQKTFKENERAHIIFDPHKIPYPEYFWGVSTSERIDEDYWLEVQQFLKERYPVLEKGINVQNQKYNPIYFPKTPQFNGKLFLLINENVASAASHFASLVKGYVEDVIIVGVETVGGYYVHNGHVPVVYELPNSKIKTQFSIVHVLQDAPLKKDQPKGRGIIPDFEVWPTLSDYFKQVDTQMEFIIKYIETHE